LTKNISHNKIAVSREWLSAKLLLLMFNHRGFTECSN